MKKLLSVLLALVILTSSLLSFVACKGDDVTDTPNTPSGPQNYTVTLKSEYGLPLSGVLVLIHDEASTNPDSSVARAETDKTGRVTFELDSEKTYSVMLFEPPLGYLPEEKYFFDSQRCASIALKSAPIDGDYSELEGYTLGDVVHDFTLTDVNGEVYKVSEVLEEKGLLILNFWFASCPPCNAEFPAFVSTYEKYSDKIEIFGINDIDPVGTIRDFGFGDSKEALPYPNFRCDTAENGFSRGEMASVFGVSAYPTTVCIDRAGVICYVRTGGLTETQLRMLVEHFTAEDYNQVLGNEVFN